MEDELAATGRRINLHGVLFSYPKRCAGSQAVVCQGAGVLVAWRFPPGMRSTCPIRMIFASSIALATTMSSVVTPYRMEIE